MENAVVKKESNLPTIQELYDDVELMATADKLMVWLNQNPPEKWVIEHPYIKGHRYLPIDKVEYLLKKIFKRYKIEVLKTGHLFNAVECQVRVHYQEPTTGEWLYHDGVGACQLQTKAGTSVTDLINLNNGAVSMALPIAKTLAVKDACDHFGRIFGSDLNRKALIAYNLDGQLINMAQEVPNELPDLNSSHPKWEAVKTALKSKNYTIVDVRKKYFVSPENYAKIMMDEQVI